MAIDPDITRRIMEEELAMMAPLSQSYGWVVITDPANRTVTVQMKSSIDNDVYILEARCDDYKGLPPYFEFIHPITKERGTKRCYPADGSYFHQTPCICVQWNRKAYNTEGGPHADWTMANWQSYRPGMNTLGDFFNLVQLQISNPKKYKGRMER